MSDRFFLDTNVFVYAFNPTDSQKFQRADELIREAISSRKGVVSYQVAQEFLNVAFRKFAVPMTHAEAEQHLAVVIRPLLGVHSSQSLFLEALSISSRYKLGWYDSLIVAAAIQGNCSHLYTEDLQHGFQIGGLRIENPFL
jgi:predicted nucleic acid-binding protein